MGLKALLISGRTLKQGMGVEMGKETEEYQLEASSIELNGEDAAELGVKNGDTISVRSKHGEIVLRCRINDSLPRGLVFVPYGPWVNVLISPETDGDGMPNYKGIEVELEKKEGAKVLTIEELIGMLSG